MIHYHGPLSKLAHYAVNVGSSFNHSSITAIVILLVHT